MKTARQGRRPGSHQLSRRCKVTGATGLGVGPQASNRFRKLEDARD